MFELFLIYDYIFMNLYIDICIWFCMKICNFFNGKYILVYVFILYKNYVFKCSSYLKEFYNVIGFIYDLYIIYYFMKFL